TQEVDLVLAERPQGQGGGGQRQGQGGGFPRNAQAGVYLGVNGEDAENAVRIINVIENGPAGKAGLKAGDLVSAVGSKTVDRYQELVEEIRTHKAGDKVQLKVRRGDQDKQIEVTLADRPAQVAAATT